MHINFEKILKSAEERLARRPGTKTEDHLTLFKNFLKIENQRLKMWHSYGGSGAEVAQGRTLLVDSIIQHVFRIADEEYRETYGQESIGCVIIALGGYGRRELNPYSDVDIMFLYPDKMTRYTDVMVNKVLYMLWDVGFHVGHSVRSIGDALRIGREDMVSKTAMLESRFIVGDKNIYDKFAGLFRSQIMEKNKEAYLEVKSEEILERHKKHGTSAFVQEPDVKEGTGGLRDLHYILWIGAVLYNSPTLKTLHEKGFLNAQEYKMLSNAYDFLLRVRTELHYQAAKKTDALSLEMQPKVAKGLGYSDGEHHRAVELFMRDYFFTARDTHQYVVRAADRWLAEKKNPIAKLIGLFTFRRTREGFVFKNKEMFAASPTVFQEDPVKLMRVFQLEQESGCRLSEELKELIRNHLKFVSRAFQISPKVRNIFLEILSHPGKVAKALRSMHETGVLGKYFPEFGRLTCMVQYDFYHKYTTDEHILRVIDHLDKVANGELTDADPYEKLIPQIEDKSLLYFGLLMHDIGKGLGGGHSQKGAVITVKICTRLGLNSEFTERSRFLVDQHLTMAHLSQRRDLNDPNLISVFARLVKDKQNLMMLQLLTFCDSNGTGNKVWTRWKEGLLWEMYVRTLHEMEEGGKSREKEILETKQRQWEFIKKFMTKIPEKKILDHFENMPNKYIRYTSFDQIADHLELVEKVKTQKVAVMWHAATPSYNEISVCTQDQPGLFYKIAGSLSLNQINILSASINTRADGIILDTFQVCDRNEKAVTDPALQAKVEESLRRVLGGELSLDEALQKEMQRWAKQKKKSIEPPSRPKVKFDNFISEKYTVLDVQVEDRLGLLYTIAHTLSRLGLSFYFAKIATEKTQVYDVFYIGDEHGKKIEDEGHLKQIKGVLEQELEGKTA